MIPLIQRVVIDEKGWMDEDEMADCIAVCQSLPGVIAINAATYIGKKREGFAGALAASFGVIMPSFIIIIAAVVFLGMAGPDKYIKGAFTGIMAASCGLIAYAAVRLGRQVIKNKQDGLICAASFLAVVFLGISAVWPILAGGSVGFLRRRAKK